MDTDWVNETYASGEGHAETFRSLGSGYRTRYQSFRATQSQTPPSPPPSAPPSMVDTQTVVSELTEGTTGSDETNATWSEIKAKLNADLLKMSLSDLKEKCKEIGLSGFSSLKKTEIVQLLESEFTKIQQFLHTKSKNELRPLYKLCDLKNCQNTKKAHLICQILSYLAANLIFKVPLEESEPEPEPTATAPPVDPVVLPSTPPTLTPPSHVLPSSVYSSPPPPQPQATLSRLELLEKQRQELENLLQEELKRQEEEEREKARKIALEEEEAKRKNEEKEKKAAAATKKKQSIPKNVRIIIWNHYIGEDIIKHKCLCCKKVTISNTNFEVGHVLSEANGGTHEINNLRPICFACNHSMGRENMIDFVVRYGLFIG